MIDKETWRATGGDDGQGHYEGDYHAEQTLAEIRALVVLAGGTEPAETVEIGDDRDGRRVAEEGQQ